MTATKSGEHRELQNTESTSKRGKPTIVSSVFHGAEPCIRTPNRLAVSVTQLGSPKGRHMILDSRFWILDCGLKQHEPHCRKRLRGERGSSSIAFMRAIGHKLGTKRRGR